MHAPDLPVPASPAEITSDWLGIALSGSFPGASFTGLEGERIGEEYGFASRLYRYQWQDQGFPRSVVVKLWEINSQAGLGELLFYQTFAEVGARVPACYFGAADRTAGRAVLVLEDLIEIIHGAEAAPFDLERAKGVARNLARLHTAWQDHPKLAEYTWITDISAWNRDRDWFHSRRTLFLERFPDRLNGLARLLLDRIEWTPAIANERLKGAPLCLLHGDFHFDNLVFENQIEPVFLDWSHPVKGGPAFNLIQLLTFMTPIQNFDPVLESYLEEFNERAKDPLNRQALEIQLGGEFLRAFTTATLGIARWQPDTARGDQLIEAGIRQANQAVDFWQGRDPELFSFLS
jgi:hypothetical protein